MDQGGGCGAYFVLAPFPFRVGHPDAPKNNQAQWMIAATKYDKTRLCRIW